MNYQPQNAELITFLVVLAVVFVIVIAIAAFAVVRRYKSGRTPSDSTYGNNIDESKDVGPARAPAPRSSTMEEPSRSDTRRNV